MTRLQSFHVPLRVRLTLWYTFSLGLILLLFTSFLYVQTRRSLIAQVDEALNLAAGQALISVGNVTGQLTFQNVTQNPDAIRNLRDDFVIQLLAQDGTVLGTLSNDDEVPTFSAHAPGFNTFLVKEEPWRVYRQAVRIEGLAGWLHVAQELEPVYTTLTNLQTQIYWGLLLALLLAGLGGFFLASRALRPIDRITQTAQTISASDLGQRIHYQGPSDEVGRLAQTFDMMLDRLQAAFARERRFISDAAHELRTPLTALKGRINVTLGQPRQPISYQETLEDMEEQVDRLIRLSKDLLFIARLDQGQIRHQIDNIELVDFMGAVVDQIRPLAEAKSITLTENIPAGMMLRGDIDLLIRLFLNLLDNAVKYTPENGRIIIRAQQRANEVQVSTSDNGPGIATEHLPYLFERFYRVEGDRARHLDNNRQGGAGLGLAIAYEIAQAQGGQLSVQSEVGRGTTFVVQLPISQHSSNAQS